MLSENFNNINVFQFGAGGTGSWLVEPLSKFLNNINLRDRNLNLNYVLVDDDIVSDENIRRQNFIHEDVGSFKSMALKRRCYWFPNLYPHREKLETKKKFQNLIYNFISTNHDRRISDRNLNLIIGCTDSVKFRRNIFSFLKNNFNYPAIYIDSGNNLHNGQILTTVFNINDKNLIKNIERFKNPNLHKFFPKNMENNDNGQNCAFFGDQSQSINIIAATQIFANIQRILIENLLPASKIDFNSSGYTTFNIL